MMERARRAVAVLALAALIGCGQAMSAAPEEGVARGTLSEPTVAPTSTQRPTSTVAPTATIAPTRLPPTSTPQPTATVRMHANGRMPEGWRIYVGTSVPVSLHYHGDWSVQRAPVGDGYFVFFTAPDRYSVLGVGPQDDFAEALADLQKMSNVEIEDYFIDAGLTGDGGLFSNFCDGGSTFDGVTRTPIAQSLFITLSVRCTYAGTPAQLQLSYGLVRDRAWGIFTMAPRADYDDLESNYFAPMIASLTFD